MFDVYASTRSDDNKKSKLLPLKVKDSPMNVCNKIVIYLKENDYQDITFKEEFYDIFAIKDEFETSFVIAIDEGYSLIQMSIYSQKKRGRTKKRLREVYEEIENLFASYL